MSPLCCSHHTNAELCCAMQNRGRDGKRLPTCSSPHAVLAGQRNNKFGCVSTADTNPVLAALCESGRLLELKQAL